MMPNNFVFLILILLSVALNSLAQTLLKLGAGQNPLNLFLFGGLAAYGLSTIFYILVLGKFNLSVAYPVVIGLTVLATTMSGVIILGEKVSSVGWIGVGLMISGIFAIAFGKVS